MILKVAKMLAFAVIGGLLAAVGGAWAQVGREPIDWTSVSMDSIGGDKLATADFKGHVVLVVNTASFCGFTAAVRGARGAVPATTRTRAWWCWACRANEFGGRNPARGRDQEILRRQFRRDFPLTAKAARVGRQAHPFYRWAARQTGAPAVPVWNFHKILIGRDGRIVEWFTAAGGMGAKLDRAIEAALDIRS